MGSTFNRTGKLFLLVRPTSSDSECTHPITVYLYHIEVPNEHNQQDRNYQLENVYTFFNPNLIPRLLQLLCLILLVMSQCFLASGYNRSKKYYRAIINNDRFWCLCKEWDHSRYVRFTMYNLGLKHMSFRHNSNYLKKNFSSYASSHCVLLQMK